MDAGTNAEVVYRETLPGAILVEEGKGWGYRKWKQAIAATNRLIGVPGTILLQPAQVNDKGVFALNDRLDIGNDGQISIVEFKGSTRVRPDHILDVAIQKYVLDTLGYDVVDAQVGYLNNKVYASDIENLFKHESVLAQVNALVPEIAARIDDFHEIISLDTPPAAIKGSHCEKCPFKHDCWSKVPKESIYTIPRLHKSKSIILQDLGVESLHKVPTEILTSQNQISYVEKMKKGNIEIDIDAISDAISGLLDTLYFLDFEAYSDSIPIVENTRPYEQVPTQFSCHILHPDGTLDHQSLIITELDGDIRLQLLTELINVLGGYGSIIVWNSKFETDILKELGKRYPEHSMEIDNIIDRVYDLAPVFKNHYFHPEFFGSNSLKPVTEALLDDMSYKDLDISEGTAATVLWKKMITKNDQIFKLDTSFDLHQYCKQDTLVMVKLYQHLKSLINAEVEN